MPSYLYYVITKYDITISIAHKQNGGSAMFKRIYDFIKETNEKRVAYWQLNNMSDKALKDMGISRGEIYNKIYGQQGG